MIATLRHNTTAGPFQWKFTRDDLPDLLARIDQHEQQEAFIELPRFEAGREPG
jgi:hypothetical protein